MSDQGGLACSNLPCPTPSQLKLYQVVIFATPIFFAMVLLSLFCVLYLRRRRIARLNSRGRPNLFPDGLFPTMQPSQRGLSKCFRQELPIVLYDERFTKCREDTQCPVCLEDYQANEKLQQLPSCGHIFHTGCIDQWLGRNTTCPICRTSLLHEEGEGEEGVCSTSPLPHHELMSSNTASGRWADQVSNGNPAASQAEAHPGEGDIPLTDVSSRTSDEHTVDIERS